MSVANPDKRVLRLFGVRLIQLRKARGWSQEDLAHESGMARSYIGGIERGQRNLALVSIRKLAETLKVPPPVLLDFTSIAEHGVLPDGKPVEPQVVALAQTLMTLGVEPEAGSP